MVRCLLSPHIAAVIAKEQSGLDSMIDNNKLDVLSRLYRLCMLIPTGMSCLRSALKASILRRGKEINDLSQSDETSEEADGKDSETPNKSDKVKAKPKVAASSVQVALDWVNNVLELKNKFDVVWRESFMSNREVEYTLNEVCICFFLLDHMSETPFRPLEASSTRTRSVQNLSRCTLTTI